MSIGRNCLNMLNICSITLLLIISMFLVWLSGLVTHYMLIVCRCGMIIFIYAILSIWPLFANLVRRPAYCLSSDWFLIGWIVCRYFCFPVDLCVNPLTLCDLPTACSTHWLSVICWQTDDSHTSYCPILNVNLQIVAHFVYQLHFSGFASIHWL